MTSRGRFLGSAFGLAFLAGAAAIIVPAAVSRSGTGLRVSATVRDPLATASLADGVSVAAQIEPADLDGLRSRGFSRIVDLRPDGEIPGQPTSAEVEAIARRLGMAFAYIPVPHGDMPDEVADRLTATLSTAEGPVLLYCRSGRRAARAWALAEASRVGGLKSDEIRARVTAVGQSVEDIADRLQARVRSRVTTN